MLVSGMFLVQQDLGSCATEWTLTFGDLLHAIFKVDEVEIPVCDLDVGMVALDPLENVGGLGEWQDDKQMLGLRLSSASHYEGRREMLEA